MILIISPLALVILMGIVKVTTSVVFASVPVIPVTVIFLWSTKLNWSVVLVLEIVRTPSPASGDWVIPPDPIS